MRDADPRKSSSGRNSRRPGGRSDGSAVRRRHAGSATHGHGISGGTERPYESRESSKGTTRGDAPDSQTVADDGYFYYDNRQDSQAASSASKKTSERNAPKGRRSPSAARGAAVATQDAARSSASTTVGRGRSKAAAKLGNVDKRRVRRFALAVAGAHGVAVLFVISLALIGIIVMGAGITPLPATIASLWMMFNVAPFGYNGTDLGLIPLLPAMLMVAFIAWRVRREVADRISLRDVRALAGSFLATPLVITLIAWLMLIDASRVLPRVNVPNFAEALLSTLLIHCTALGIGMGQRLIRALLRRRKWPEWLLSSARIATRYIMWLWAAGAVVLVISLIWHHQLFRDAYVITANASEAAALSALSALYIPNVAFVASGILVGAPANIGAAEAGLFAVTPGTMPPLPILAAFPQSHLSVAFGALLLIPAGIAVAVVIQFLKKNTVERPYAVVVVAALWAGVLAAALAWLSGGVVGVYGWSGTSVWLTGLLVSMWLAVPGAVVAIAMTGFPRRESEEPSGVAAETFPAQERSAEESGEDEQDSDAAEETVDGEVVAEDESTEMDVEANESEDNEPENAESVDGDSEEAESEDVEQEGTLETPAEESDKES